MAFSAFGLHAASNGPQYVSGQAAVTVVGQQNFSDNVPGAAANQLGTVSGIAIAGDKLIVCDGGTPFSGPSNNRILIFSNLSSLANGQAASVVIGQPDFTSTTIGLSQTSLNQPSGIASDGRRLVVADTMNNRVLIFNAIPTSNGVAADLVLGQPDFKTNVPANSATGLRAPQGVFIDGQRLMIADTLNHRVIIFNTVPTSNGAKPDMVLGQANLTSSVDQAASAASLRDPTSVFFDGTRLIITDLGHNRVLIYNHLPTSDNAAADVVVGQPDMSSEAPGTSSSSLNFPRYAVTDGTRLFIADTGNNRILVYNTIPTTNGAAADAVLGQRDFITQNDVEATDPQRLTSMIMGAPVAIAANTSGLYVADASDRRVLKFAPGIPMLTIGSVVNAANFGGNGLSQPQNVKVSVQSDDTSTLPAGTYYIKVAAEGGIMFESVGSQEIAVTVPDKSKMVVTFDEVASATAYRAYVGLIPGGESWYFDTANPASGQPIDRTITINTIAGTNGVPPTLQIVPGSIAAVFGTGLAPDTVTAQAIPLPTQLDGVSVLVNGIAAPLFFVSPNQINFQVPWEAKGLSASVMIRKTSPGGTVTYSNATPVALSNSNPGAFTTSADGTGNLLAFHSDWTLVDDQHPIVPGETVIFFLTGVQDIDTTPVTGDASPVSNITTTVSVSMRSFGANILYAGLAPGFVGVFQMNVQVPKDIEADGKSADVRVIIGAIPANLTYLPVAQPFGHISVGPAPNYTVTWSSSGYAATQVFVSTDGAGETLFSNDPSGSVSPPWIQPGHVYVFNLRSFANNTPGDVIASATLDTR